MSSYKPAIHTVTTVTASNKWLVFKHGVTTYSTYIPVTTYTNAWSLCNAVASSMTSASAGTITVTLVGCPIYGSLFGQYGWVKVTDAGGADLQFLWASGGHAASNAHTILGWGTANSDTDPTIYSSLQIPNVWFSCRVPASDSYDRRRRVGGKPREALSGACLKTLTIGTVRYREVAFELLTDDNVLARAATGAYTNRDFETVWLDIVRGESFQYYTDQTSSTPDATYYLFKPDTLEDIRRPHPEAGLYSFALEMMRKE